MIMLKNCNHSADKDRIYSSQATVQVFLLLLALVCVPWMLCTKPYLVWKETHDIKKEGYQGVSQTVNDNDEDEDEENANPNGSGSHDKKEGEEEGHDFSEVVIHQTIHTSEVFDFDVRQEMLKFCFLGNS
jgi:V-type H+-transporting ATPase subunit a